MELTRQGLYYCAVCRCSLTGEGMCRLEAENGEKKLDLGILVPEEGGFGLRTRFPVSRLGEGAASFRVVPKQGTGERRKYIPIKPEEPFGYLARLKDAFLEIRGEQMGASIPISDTEL